MPEGSLELLSQHEVNRLRSTGEGGQHEVLRRCALAVLNVGGQTDDTREVLEKYSDFFLSIRISYPNSADASRARSGGHAPGGAIMIHGLPNNPTRSPDYYRRTDWTNGCIAVSNADMVDIWLMTTRNTPIDILP